MIRAPKFALDQLGLEKHRRLRRALKRCFSVLNDPFQRGRHLVLASGAEIHVPTYFATAGWLNCETDAMREYTTWLCENPNVIVVDAGCSLAISSIDHEEHWWCEPQPPAAL